MDTALLIALSALVICAEFAAIALTAVDSEDWTDVTRASTEARFTERMDALLLIALSAEVIWAELVATAAETRLTALEIALSAEVIWAELATMAESAPATEAASDTWAALVTEPLPPAAAVPFLRPSLS